MDRLSARLREKLSIKVFNYEVDQFSQNEIATRENLRQIRFGSSHCKKFVDEIMPMWQMLHLHRITRGHIQFPQDSEIPDCFFWKQRVDKPQEIEITVSQGRERFHRMRELV
jgi:hypothetical protein